LIVNYYVEGSISQEGLSTTLFAWQYVLDQVQSYSAPVGNWTTMTPSLGILLKGLSLITMWLG